MDSITSKGPPGRQKRTKRPGLSKEQAAYAVDLARRVAATRQAATDTTKERDTWLREMYSTGVAYPAALAEPFHLTRERCAIICMADPDEIDEDEDEI